MLGNAPAQSGHRDATLALTHTRGADATTPLPPPGVGGAAAELFSIKASTSPIQNAAILARTGYGCWIQTVFFDQAPYGRRQ